MRSTGSGRNLPAPVEPAYARKLLHDLTTWSQSQGFWPHRDYAKVEPLFGAVNATASHATFAFGQDGKPLIVDDMSETIWHSTGLDVDDGTIDSDVSEIELLEDASHTAWSRFLFTDITDCAS
jgi:hypothetical protein